MRIHFQSEIQGDYLHIMAEGSMYNIEDMSDYVEQIHMELARMGLVKLLVDERRCHVHMNFDGLEDVASHLHEPEGFGPNKPKAAIVSSAMNFDLFRHIFHLVKRIKIFTDVEEAKEWLAAG